MNRAKPLHGGIEEDFRARTPGSARLFARACAVIPAGLTHDSRATLPYPVWAARAQGPRKWDVDGKEYVHYFGGHRALLLGHSHPAVVEAVQRQMPLGTHWGASHALEVQWAELVQRLIPSAERVRFTASGHLEMAWHLYTWGDAVEVLAPQPLRAMVERHRRGDFPALP